MNNIINEDSLLNEFLNPQPLRKTTFNEEARKHSNRSSYLISKEKYRKAIEEANKALALDNKYADAFFNKGVALENSSDYHNAEICYSESISINSKDYEYYLRRGSVLSLQEKYIEALDDINRALKLDRHNRVELLLARAEIYVNMDKKEQALQDLQELVYNRSSDILPQRTYYLLERCYAFMSSKAYKGNDVMSKDYEDLYELYNKINYHFNCIHKKYKKDLELLNSKWIYRFICVIVFVPLIIYLIAPYF